MKTKELFEAAFAEMPDAFSSYEFRDALIKKGATPENLKGNQADYLHKVATNKGIRGKHWTKRKKYQTPTEQLSIAMATKLNGTTPYPALDAAEADAIALLKSKGYRILKPATEWTDL